MSADFHLVPDRRTPRCRHDQDNGCYHCCRHCNYDLHACGQCAEPMTHETCGGDQKGWCTPCRTDHYTQVDSVNEEPNEGE